VNATFRSYPGLQQDKAEFLLQSRARTIEQIRLIYALCRFAEMAADQGANKE
jgi:hypothetical protein